jgi:hypothetical protein
LEIARLESQQGLLALTNAAAIAGSSGEKIKSVVAAMQDKIYSVRRIAGRLDHSVASLKQAGAEINGILENCGFAATDLTQADRETIEDHCARSYTSEWERRILQSVLRGEPMPLAGTAATGNDVDLF